MGHAVNAHLALAGREQTEQNVRQRALGQPRTARTITVILPAGDIQANVLQRRPGDAGRRSEPSLGPGFRRGPATKLSFGPDSGSGFGSGLVGKRSVARTPQRAVQLHARAAAPSGRLRSLLQRPGASHAHERTRAARARVLAHAACKRNSARQQTRERSLAISNSSGSGSAVVDRAKPNQRGECERGTPYRGPQRCRRAEPRKRQLAFPHDRRPSP